jgi:hypothetical protein
MLERGGARGGIRVGHGGREDGAMEVGSESWSRQQRLRRIPMVVCGGERG